VTARVIEGDHCDMSVSYLPSQTLHAADPALALWNLLARPTIDPATLARAIETIIVEPSLDWRTLQLVKEGWQALEESIEPGLLNDYLLEHTSTQIAEAIRARSEDAQNSHCDVKFPSLKERLMPHLSPMTIRQFLRELGSAIAHPATITMGGAASLVLRGLLSRATEDVDVVDEVPAEIRDEREILEDLSARYGLRMTHFQSHYLPRDWESRTIDFGAFGKIQVRLVDALDIIAGKVCSARPKDLDDFRVLSLNVNKEELRQRVLQGSSNLISSDQNRRQAISNWYIVYGDDLGLSLNSGAEDCS
jgi:Nucleotidyltransferase of unknown function (DUF6036)